MALETPTSGMKCQRCAWVGSIHGLGWVGSCPSQFPKYSWVELGQEISTHVDLRDMWRRSLTPQNHKVLCSFKFASSKCRKQNWCKLLQTFPQAAHISEISPLTKHLVGKKKSWLQASCLSSPLPVAFIATRMQLSERPTTVYNIE